MHFLLPTTLLLLLLSILTIFATLTASLPLEGPNAAWLNHRNSPSASHSLPLGQPSSDLQPLVPVPDAYSALPVLTNETGTTHPATDARMNLASKRKQNELLHERRGYVQEKILDLDTRRYLGQAKRVWQSPRERRGSREGRERLLEWLA